MDLKVNKLLTQFLSVLKALQSDQLCSEKHYLDKEDAAAGGAGGLETRRAGGGRHERARSTRAALPAHPAALSRDTAGQAWAGAR
ncbi:hypothetical protein EVAR_5674_1 [Eumeta japonica]|uniref:Uncharacterized protein n=1 Tax=Eumeta variegata TaxID=151549 RepID=A0A4C1T790_EUMVA|nr:hypothetical protein EVAR_5674_1 [Eumeta japonica]